MRPHNLFDTPIPETGETFTTLLKHKNLKIVRIVSSDNIEPVTYDQDEDEWVAVLEGEAVLEMDDEQISLQRGDTLFIPAHTLHKVLETQKGTVWLAVHISP